MSMAAHIAARILAGRPLPLIGRLLADTRDGATVALDPVTGGELTAADDRPAFVLSTESEATDGHIVRQHWDLSRADGAGIPILWNHNPNDLLGRWEDLAVRDIGTGRPALVGRAHFDPEDPTAQLRKGQVKRGFLSATSVGWMPGESVRRGELAATDPLYREPIDGPCGPEEGMVMGTEGAPNRLIEATITPVPAQADAIAIERLHRGGSRDLEHALRGEAHDPDRLLAFVANHPRARAWLHAEITRAVRAEMQRAAVVAPPSSPSSTRPRTLGDLFKGD